MDNLEILIQAILSLKDVTESKKQILSELPKLESQLQSDKKSRVNIFAGLDVTKSKNLIQSQLNTITNQAKAPVIKVGIDIDNKNAGQNIVGNLKNIESHVSQSINNIKQVASDISLGDVSDKMIADFQKKFSIVGKQAEQTKTSFKELFVSLNNSWYSDNIDSYYDTLNRIVKLTETATKELVPKYQKNLIADLKSQLSDGSKVFIDDKLKEELKHVLGTAKEAQKVLNSVFGAGKWTYKQNGAVPFDTLISDELLKRSGGLADAIKTIYNNIQQVKGERIDVFSNLSDTEATAVIENHLHSILKLSDAYIDAEGNSKTYVGGLGWFDDISIDADKTSQSINNVKESVQETQNTLKNKTNGNYFYNNNALLQSIQLFNEEEDAVAALESTFKSLGATVSSVERANKDGLLRSFSINVKTKTGELERFNYALKNIGTDEEPNFKYVLSNIIAANEGVQKLSQSVSNAIADYEQKFAQFKSTNSSLISGLSKPIAEFESKLNGLKNGTESINTVANAFKMLNVEVSNITANFDRKLNPIDAAIRNISKGEETIKGLRAEFSGLNNTPKEINAELSKCAKLLENVKNIEQKQGRTQEWSKAYREWTTSVDILTSKLKTLKKEQTNASSTQIFNVGDLNKNNIAYISEICDTIDKQMRSIQNMANKQGWEIIDVNGVEDSTGEIKKLNLTIRDTEGALKRVVMQREQLQDNGKIQYGFIQSGDIKILQTAAQTEAKLTNDRIDSLRKYSNEIDNTISKLQSLNSHATFQNNASNPEVVKAKSGISDLIAEYQKLQTQLQGNVSPESLKEIEAELTKLNSRFSSTKNSAEKLQMAFAETNGVDKLEQRINLLIKRIEAYKNVNPKAMKQFGSQIENMLSELKGGNLDKVGVDKISKQFQILRLEIQRTGKTGKGFFETLTDQAKKFSSWMTLTGVITSAWHSIRQMVDNVIELDNSLLELSKVSDLSAEGLKNITKEAYSLGEEVGKTGTQVIDAITNFKRAGFSIEDSTNFAEDALILTNVAEGINDAGEAATALISIMKGYHDTTPEFSQKILDAINEVSNTQAINFDDLVDGSQRLSAVAKQAGMSFEQMLGVLTGTNEVLQNIEKTSAGEITIFTRLQAIQLPDEEDVMPLAKLQSTINTATKGAVDIVDQSTGELRNVYDILNDINDVWDTLDKNTQEGIAFAAAGTRQKNVFLSMMENWENVENATNSAMDSMGSSTIENQKYLDSVQGKLANLESSFQSLSNTVVNSDLIKFAVGLGTDLLNLLDGLISKLGAIPTLLTAISAGLAVKNVGELLNTPVYAQPQLICA